MIKVLSIDPGKHRTAWAAWADSELVGVGIALAPDRMKNVGDLALSMVEQMPAGADEIVCEGMVVQHGRTWDPDDMLKISYVSSFIAGYMRPSVFTLTNGTRWKEDRPKNIQQGRDRKALVERERVLLDNQIVKIPLVIQNDVLDAVGIGLWYLRNRRKAVRNHE